MSIISLEVKTQTGISSYTLGRVPVQNDWVTNWFGIIDEIAVNAPVNRDDVTITILFTDGRSIVTTALKSELMIVRAKDEDDYNKFKEEQIEKGVYEFESQFEDERNIKKANLMPVNLGENIDG